MVYELPHILVPGRPATDRFQRRGGGGSEDEPYEIPNRRAHADALREDLEGTITAALIAREQWPEILKAKGITLSVMGWPGGFELALESLDLRGSDIELLSVKLPVGDPPSAELATVFVPDAQVGQFLSRLDRFTPMRKHQRARRATKSWLPTSLPCGRRPWSNCGRITVRIPERVSDGGRSGSAVRDESSTRLQR